MTFSDVFRSSLRLPPRVCILAPGELGRRHHAEIPADRCVIAVGKAVLARDAPPPRIWMMNHASQPWFDEANAAFTGVRVFGYEAARSAAPRTPRANGCYYYRPPSEHLAADRVLPVDGVIRYGATVSGCALQFACNFGAQDVLLCGVDMSGDGYWDGTANVHPNHGKTWGAVQRLDPLIRWLSENRSMSISTLSETKLDVPRYRSAMAMPEGSP